MRLDHLLSMENVVGAKRHSTVFDETRNPEQEAVVQFSGTERGQVGHINAEGPPVPIPNTEVKLCSGENTLLATARENNSMLTSEKRAERSALLTERIKVELQT